METTQQSTETNDTNDTQPERTAALIAGEAAALMERAKLAYVPADIRAAVHLSIEFMGRAAHELDILRGKVAALQAAAAEVVEQTAGGQ